MNNDGRYRVAYIITGLTTGGAEMMLYKLLSGTDRTKFSPTVISLGNRGTMAAKIESLNVPVLTIEMKPGRFSLRGLFRLITIVRRLQPHLIQGWMYHGNLAASTAALLSGRQYVCWNIRQSLYSLSSEKRGTAIVIKIGAFLSRFPNRIIFNARESLEQHTLIGYNRKSSEVIPNGFNTTVFFPNITARRSVRTELGILPDDLVVGMTARYHPQKDLDNFLDAVVILLRKYYRAHFVLTGKGMESFNTELNHMIRSRGLTDQVHLLGERNDVPKITASLDIATLSSAYGEAFPNVLAEAMACEVPCVATNVGDSAWVLGDTGRIVPPRNPQALADAWYELISMGADKRNELGKKARQRVCDHFSLGSVVKQYEALYERLLTGKR